MIDPISAEAFQVAEIIPNLFSFVTVRNFDKFRASPIYARELCYCTDADLLYEPFYADFGPLNLGLAYQFFSRTSKLLAEARQRGVKLCYYAGPGPSYIANAAVLVGMFQVLGLGLTGEEAYRVLAPMEMFWPFRDASCGPPVFNLTVQDCIMGVARARDKGFVNFLDLDSEAEMHEYQHYERVENGDMTWILPGKLLAFSGPAAVARSYRNFTTKTPEDYWRYFQEKGITTVVRLNNQVYDPRQFLAGGFKVEELYFPDGTCPSEAILQTFLRLAETEPGALAVHCKAGLGRTGILICSYLIKHYDFTAREAIGYIRVVRPGSVIASQQTWLLNQAAKLQREGTAYRLLNKQPPARLPLWPSAETLAQLRQPKPSAAVSAAEPPRPVFTISADCRMAVQSTSVRYTAQQLQTVPPGIPQPGPLLVGPTPAISAESGESGPVEAATVTGSGDRAPAPVGGSISTGYAKTRLNCISFFSNFCRRFSMLLRLGNGTAFESRLARNRPSRRSSKTDMAQAVPAGTPAVVPALPTTNKFIQSSSLKTRTAAAVDVARALAPNGQPRKIPAAFLSFASGELDTFEMDEERPEGASGWTIGASSSVA